MVKNYQRLFFENRGIRQTIFKNTFWLMWSEFFAKGIAFFIFIWLARHFGPEIYGQWAFALSFVSLFVILIDFGFSTLTIRELARDKLKYSQYVDNILAMKLVLGLASLGLIAFLIQFLGKEQEVIRLVYFLALYVIINNFTTFFQSIFRAYEKMQYETICKAVQNLSLLGLSAFFILTDGSILAISYAYVGAVLIGFLCSFVLLWSHFPKFFLKVDWKICREILGKTWPFLFSGIFYMIYFRIDSTMLGIFSDMKEVGYYNAAFNLFIAIFIIPEIITMSFFPKMSYFYKKDKEKLKQIFSNFKSLLAIIGLPLAAFLLLFSNVII
ncbi:flippase, partial [Patescibacteria group bacterium]